jgi:hypothetical protein
MSIESKNNYLELGKVPNTVGANSEHCRGKKETALGQKVHVLIHVGAIGERIIS